MLNGISACFTDSDEQIGNRTRRGTDRRQPMAHRKADIPQRPWQRRHYEVKRTNPAAVLATHRDHRNIIARGITTNELGHDLRTHGIHRARHYRLTQVLEAGVKRDVLALNQAVSIEADERARRYGDGSCPASQSTGHPYRMIARYVEEGRRLIGEGTHRRRMACRRQVQPLKRWFEHRQEHRGHHVRLEVLYLLVKSSEHLGGITAEECVGAQCAAQPAHHVGGTKTAPDDISDHDA